MRSESHIGPGLRDGEPLARVSLDRRFGCIPAWSRLAGDCLAAALPPRLRGSPAKSFSGRRRSSTSEAGICTIRRRRSTGGEGPRSALGPAPLRARGDERRTPREAPRDRLHFRLAANRGSVAPRGGAGGSTAGHGSRPCRLLPRAACRRVGRAHRSRRKGLVSNGSQEAVYSFVSAANTRVADKDDVRRAFAGLSLEPSGGLKASTTCLPSLEQTREEQAGRGHGNHESAANRRIRRRELTRAWTRVARLMFAPPCCLPKTRSNQSQRRSSRA